MYNAKRYVVQADAGGKPIMVECGVADEVDENYPVKPLDRYVREEIYAALEAECFKLAASQCKEPYSDDYGNVQCRIQLRLTALERITATVLDAVKGANEAADELMTEFISKTRAADWGKINRGLLAVSQLGKAFAALPKTEGPSHD